MKKMFYVLSATVLTLFISGCGFSHCGGGTAAYVAATGCCETNNY